MTSDPELTSLNTHLVCGDGSSASKLCFPKVPEYFTLHFGNNDNYIRVLEDGTVETSDNFNANKSAENFVYWISKMFKNKISELTSENAQLKSEITKLTMKLNEQVDDRSM